MNNISNGLFVLNQVPIHLLNSDSRFVALMVEYQRYLNRHEGLNNIETDLLDAKLSEKYSSEGVSAIKHMKIENEWDKIKRFQAPSDQSVYLISDYCLERIFDTFVSSVDEFFITQDGYVYESSRDRTWGVDNWMSQYQIQQRFVSESLEQADDTLFALLLKQMFAAKGTTKCVEIFFSMFFGEVVEIYLPKFDICEIDNNFNLDSNKFLRDDEVNQEYSYVILVNDSVDKYTNLFQNVYMKHFHPAGFKVTLRQKPTIQGV